MIEFEQGLKGNYLTVWNLRIASEDPMTMDEIGKRIGRTRQRVEQIDRKLREDFLRYARKHK
jgi:DNA-directed RNA polymerase sigma subunit (sigma70/sigma32)